MNKYHMKNKFKIKFSIKYCSEFPNFVFARILFVCSYIKLYWMYLGVLRYELKTLLLCISLKGKLSTFSWTVGTLTRQEFDCFETYTIMSPTLTGTFHCDWIHPLLLFWYWQCLTHTASTFIFAFWAILGSITDMFYFNAIHVCRTVELMACAAMS